jgi:hypothetical protein
VPYLFEENFSDVTLHNYIGSTTDWNETAKSMDEWNLIGWSGARWRTNAATSLTVSAYIGTSVSGRDDTTVTGRADSCPLPLKSSSDNVTISVSYKVSGYTAASAAKTSCYFGITTREGLVHGGRSYKNIVIADIPIDNYPLSDGSEDGITANTPKEHLSIKGCGSKTRLTWCCIPTSVATSLRDYVTRKYFYIHIDDIKVSIGNEVK